MMRKFRSSSLFAAFCAAVLFAFAFTANADPSPNPTEGTTMQASPAQVVMTKGFAIANNTNVHPAIVTRSFNANDLTPGGTATGMVNLAVIPDTGHHIVPHTSVTLYATEADGDAATTARDFVSNGQIIVAQPRFAYYPDGTFPAAEPPPTA